MRRAKDSYARDLFDLIEADAGSTEPVAPQRIVVLMFSYNNRTVATPARNGKRKRTHRSIVSRLHPWMAKVGESGVIVRAFQERTADDTNCKRVIVVHDFDPAYCVSADHGAIGALVRRGAKLFGVSGTQRGDSAYASFKSVMRGEGFMELIDKRLGFVAIVELLRRHIRESIAA